MRDIVNLASALALALTQVAAPALAQQPGDKMARPQVQPPGPPTTKPAPVRPRPPVTIQPPRPGPAIQPPRPRPEIQPPRPIRPQPPRPQPIRPPVIVVPPGGGYYPPGGGNWNGATIRCESRNNRYNECRAFTAGGVRLVRVRGGNCQQGRTWGWRADRIWVNNGCRADFQTRAGNGGGGYYPPQNDGPSAGAVIGGVAVAAGLIALLAASQKKPASSAPPPFQPPAGGGGAPATITASTGGVTPDARPSLTTCLNEAARQIGATGGTEIRLDRLDEIEKGNGGYRFRFQLQGVYPDETRTIPTYCRATPTSLVELTFG